MQIVKRLGESSGRETGQAALLRRFILQQSTGCKDTLGTENMSTKKHLLGRHVRSTYQAL